MRYTDLLKGWGYSPIVVGLVRGVIGAAVAAGVGALIVGLDALEWGEYAGLSPIVLLILRTIEAQADQLIDAKQNTTAEVRAKHPPQ